MISHGGVFVNCEASHCRKFLLIFAPHGAAPAPTLTKRGKCAIIGRIRNERNLIKWTTKYCNLF